MLPNTSNGGTVILNMSNIKKPIQQAHPADVAFGRANLLIRT